MTTYTTTTMPELLQQEVKGLSTYLVDDDYNNAIRDAQIDTGFALPLDDATYEFYWLKERAKRHLFFYLYTESAHKFKVDQINLQHRFEHYDKILKTMDDRFTAEIESRPDKFGSANPLHMFGSKIDAGFAYDHTGYDITYDDEQLVIVSPSDSD